jgi:hypothetical protein
MAVKAVNAAGKPYYVGVWFDSLWYSVVVTPPARTTSIAVEAAQASQRTTGGRPKRLGVATGTVHAASLLASTAVRCVFLHARFLLLLLCDVRAPTTVAALL